MLTLLQIIVSVLLITVILMQSRGSGLGSAFGGVGESFHSRRGIERVLFRSTIGLVFIFLALSFLPILGF